MEIKSIHDLVAGYRINRWTFIRTVNRKRGNWVHARCDCGTERDYFSFGLFYKKRPYSCTHCSPRYGIPPNKLKKGKRYNGWKVIKQKSNYSSVYEVECKKGHRLKTMGLGLLIGDEKPLCKKCVPIYQRGGRKKSTRIKPRG